jgi:hypothetical protein
LAACAERASVRGHHVENFGRGAQGLHLFLCASLFLRFSIKQAPSNVSLFDILRQIYVADSLRHVSDLFLLRRHSQTKKTGPFSGRKERIITRDPFGFETKTKDPHVLNSSLRDAILQQ